MWTRTLTRKTQFLKTATDLAKTSFISPHFFPKKLSYDAITPRGINGGASRLKRLLQKYPTKDLIFSFFFPDHSKTSLALNRILDKALNFTVSLAKTTVSSLKTRPKSNK